MVAVAEVLQWELLMLFPDSYYRQSRLEQVELVVPLPHLEAPHPLERFYPQPGVLGHKPPRMEPGVLEELALPLRHYAGLLPQPGVLEEMEIALTLVELAGEGAGLLMVLEVGGGMETLHQERLVAVAGGQKPSALMAFVAAAGVLEVAVVGLLVWGIQAVAALVVALLVVMAIQVPQRTWGGTEGLLEEGVQDGQTERTDMSEPLTGSVSVMDTCLFRIEIYLVEAVLAARIQTFLMEEMAVMVQAEVEATMPVLAV